MSSTDRFLDLYNKLDSLSRDHFHLDDRSESAIIRLINELHRSSSSSDVDLGDALDSLRQLRNTLVHTEKVAGQDLAEVNPVAIDMLLKAIAMLDNPPKAFASAIGIDRVFSCAQSDLVSFVLTRMIKGGYSHVPVLDAKGILLGVFSENVICSYLNDHQDISLKSGLKIDDLASYIPLDKHDNERYLISSKDALLKDVEEAFGSSKRRTGKRLGMVLFTEHGSEEEKIIGILVPSVLYQ